MAGFTIFPDNVWVLETGREYVIHVHIFDKNNHKIYPTEVSPGGGQRREGRKERWWMGSESKETCRGWSICVRERKWGTVLVLLTIRFFKCLC